MFSYLLRWFLLCCMTAAVELSADSKSEAQTSLKRSTFGGVVSKRNEGGAVDGFALPLVPEARPRQAYHTSSATELKLQRKPRFDYYRRRKVFGEYEQPKLLSGGYYETSMTGQERRVVDERHGNKKITTDEKAPDQELAEKQEEVKPLLPEKKLEFNESSESLENLFEEADLHTKQLSREGSSEPLGNNWYRHYYSSPLKNRDFPRNKVDRSGIDNIAHTRITQKPSLMSKMWRRYSPLQHGKVGHPRHHVTVSLVGLEDSLDAQVDPTFDQRIMFRRPVFAVNSKFLPSQIGQFKTEEEDPEDGEYYNQVLPRSNKNGESPRAQSSETDVSCRCKGCCVGSSSHHCGGGINISILLPSMAALGTCQVKSSTSCPKNTNKAGKKGKKKKGRRQVVNLPVVDIQKIFTRKRELSFGELHRNVSFHDKKSKAPPVLDGRSTVKNTIPLVSAESNNLPKKISKVEEGSLTNVLGVKPMLARSEEADRYHDLSGVMPSDLSEGTLTFRFTTPAIKGSPFTDIRSYQKLQEEIDSDTYSNEEISGESKNSNLNSEANEGLAEALDRRGHANYDSRNEPRSNELEKSYIAGNSLAASLEESEEMGSFDQWDALDDDLNNDLLDRQLHDTGQNNRNRKREADYEERLDQLEGYYRVSSGRIPGNMIVSALRHGKGKYNRETITNTKLELMKERPQDVKLPEFPSEIDRKNGRFIDGW